MSTGSVTLYSWKNFYNVFPDGDLGGSIMRSISNSWYKLFLIERPSISLGLFRIAVALTTIFHVGPTLCHLGDNYFSTAYRSVNPNFFPFEFIQLVQRSPDWVVVIFVYLFIIFSFFFLVGLWSQLSCIVMAACCYFFYALNSFHIGTLSWDILLVTLFLMCVTPYHGDYFSIDCLSRGNADSFKKARPYFLQRLLQLQIGFTFFYTALYKVTGEGNWLKGNPLYCVLNYPSQGVTKNFLLRDFMMDQPGVCYWLGIVIVVIEFSMIFLLFWRRTRVSGIYLGVLFHVILILTLDVPAIFFFLFPTQLMLFINPEKIVQSVDLKREGNLRAGRWPFIFDGDCGFCRKAIRIIKIMDLLGKLEYVNFREYHHLTELHPELTYEKANRMSCLIVEKRLYGGFDAFRKISLVLPMLFPMVFIFYFPGMRSIGSILYTALPQDCD